MLNGRRVFKDKRVYLMRDHQWAFYAWELARQNFFIKAPTTLFHIDAHLDDLPDALEIPGWEKIDTPEEALNFTENLNIDNFIWPAFARGTVDQIVYVTQEDQEEGFEEWTKYRVPGKVYTGIHLRSFDEFIDKIATEQLVPFVQGQSKILNLDLDFFNKGTMWNSNPILYSDRQILYYLEFLRDLYQWDLITVAMSPEYCGGNDACSHLLNLFLQVFELELDNASDW